MRIAPEDRPLAQPPAPSSATKIRRYVTGAVMALTVASYPGYLLVDHVAYVRERDRRTDELIAGFSSHPESDRYTTDEHGCDPDVAACYEVVFVGDEAYQTDKLFVLRYPL